MTTTNEVTYRFEYEQDDTSVRGNVICSGDDAFDKQVEDATLERLELGYVEAWALCKVTAEIIVDGNVFKGTAYLGGCSYDTAIAMKADVQPQLEPEALADLAQTLKREVARGAIAAKVLNGFAGEQT